MIEVTESGLAIDFRLFVVVGIVVVVLACLLMEIHQNLLRSAVAKGEADRQAANDREAVATGLKEYRLDPKTGKVSLGMASLRFYRPPELYFHDPTAGLISETKP